jgi:hypothetical protein
LVSTFAAGLSAYGATLAACGGTTGREGLGTPDASVGDDGGFDVSIQYIDRVLPDLYVAPMDSGGGDGAGWPNCAPDLPVFALVDDAGNVTEWFINADGSVPADAPASLVPDEIPAVWQDGGAEIPAPDGSVCATRAWLGSSACDRCLKLAFGGTLGNPWYGEYGNTAVLPPCSDMAEAGRAVAGPAANTPRFDLCVNMFKCILRTQCFAAGINGTEGTALPCICNPGDDCMKAGPTGPCALDIQKAEEVQGSNPGDTFTKMGMAFNVVTTPDQPGHGAGSLGSLFSDLISGSTTSCLPACTGDAASE